MYSSTHLSGIGRSSYPSTHLSGISRSSYSSNFSSSWIGKANKTPVHEARINKCLYEHRAYDLTTAKNLAKIYENSQYFKANGDPTRYSGYLETCKDVTKHLKPEVPYRQPNKLPRKIRSLESQRQVLENTLSPLRGLQKLKNYLLKWSCRHQQTRVVCHLRKRLVQK